MIGIVDELRKVTGTDHRVGEHDRGRTNFFERIGIPIESYLTQRARKRRALAAEHREHRARHLDGAFQIENAEFGADVPVRNTLMLRPRSWIVANTNALDLDVVGLALAVGAIRRRKIRDVE
ncbi:unannotated protein [freshwater metagenome]|uniref:Unannotated protein n=1 Tax=freshwater metagenome TaxID=449393 RepID=A0A6J7J2F1_9ZZZZ